MRHVVKNLVSRHQVTYGLQVFSYTKSICRPKQRPSIGTLVHLHSELHGLEWVEVGQKNTFFEITQSEQQIFKNEVFSQRVQPIALLLTYQPAS